MVSPHSSPCASGAQMSPVRLPSQNAASGDPTAVLPACPVAVVLEPPVAPGPLSAEGGGSSGGGADVADPLGADPGQEALVGAGSVPPSPTQSASPADAAATPETLATRVELGSESAVVQCGRSELTFEKRQHELEVAAWSRERKERADALALLGCC